MINLIQLENYFYKIEDYKNLPQGLPVRTMFEALFAGEYEECDQLALELFHSTETNDEKCFYLYLLIATSEQIFDLELRQQRIQLWKQVPHWISSPYAQFLHALQEGLTAFYGSYLTSAQHFFQQALQVSQIKDLKFCELRALFHLGLTHRDLGQTETAKAYFHSALRLAEQLKIERMIINVQKQLNKLENNVRSLDTPLMESLLKEGQFKQARQLYLRLKSERPANESRRSRSLHVFLPLILIGLGRDLLARVAEKFIEDQILKYQMLRLKRDIFTLSQDEEELFGWLEQHFSTSSKENIKTVNSHLLKVKIEKLNQPDLRKLYEVLSQSKDGLSKEHICEVIWNITYDPVLHDNKIYKLINRFRKSLEDPDAVLNQYGSYRLNPKSLYG